MGSLAELRAQGHTIIQPDKAEECHASGKLRSPNVLYKVQTAHGPAWECLPDNRCKSLPCSQLAQTSGAGTAAAGGWGGAAGGQQLWGSGYGVAAMGNLWAQPTYGGAVGVVGGARFDPYGGAASYGGGGNDALLKTLIDKVKAGQRSSESWKENWWAWCDANGGTRDPARRTVQELTQALQQIGDPSPGTVGGGSGGGASVIRDAEHQKLVDQVKQQQRSNPTWKAGWDSLCDAEGQGRRDPARHDSSFLRQAIAQLG
eukprot:TRINITY_DN9856_c0_g1_i1.p1 TRINITY_DN9856_c0_g1~~TRINITY_DN9856_c0_g1_i1.p1  ORF type:complete len:290 (+),score=78.01 TRINITY_DN9856_c0_g1_i1:95-871(+)